MTTSFHTGSATIYEFPVRNSVTSRRAREGAKPVAEITDIRVARVCDAAFGSGWYHEAAIEEAELARKR